MSETDTHSPPSGMHWIYRMLAVLLTLAIVAVVFWQNKPSGDQSSGDTGGNPPTTASFPTDIESLGPNMWRATAGGAMAFVAGDPADRFEYRMRMFGMVDDDTRTLMRAYRMLTFDEGARQNIALSDEQWTAIQAIDVPRLVISAADRSEFESRWRTWERADAKHKTDAQTAVLDQLGEMGSKGIEPTRRAWADAGQKLRKILTLQQMAKLAVYMQSNTGPGPGFGNPFAPSPTTRRNTSGVSESDAQRILER